MILWVVISTYWLVFFFTAYKHFIAELNLKQEYSFLFTQLNL